MQNSQTLRAGDQVPHFRVQDLDHTPVAYSQIWQRKNLLLVLLPGEPSAAADLYVAQLRERMPELAAHDTVCVVSRDAVGGLPQPGVVVADKWGEIHFVASGNVGALPATDDIIEWLRYVQVQCPECQGEAR